MILLLIPAVIVAILVGQAFGWQWVFAPLLGLFIWTWARSTLRSMVHGGSQRASDPPPEAVDASERTLYWCEECGTEYLLIVRGSGAPPRHCGTRMHVRSEILN